MKNSWRLYGFILGVSHLVTLYFWQAYDFDFGLLHKLQTAHFNSWPFVPASYSDFVASQASPLTMGYIALSWASLAAFLPALPRFVGFATLGAAFLLKLMIYFSSYDFMGNYHYMSNLVMAAFLVTRGNLFFIQIMMAFFYFGAGLIKLNWEWLSGSALLRETFLTGPWLIAACLYAVVLELVLIWGLFAKNKTLRLLTLLQLVAFHLFSWHIVGFYYPVTMILLLSVFLIHPASWQSELLPLRKFRLPVWIYAYVAVFLVMQLYPKLLGRNEALTAEGRMLSLNMLDAKTECLPSFEIKTAEGHLYQDQPLSYATRIRCDPLVWMNYGKTLCHGQWWTETPSVKLNLTSKKTTDTSRTWVVQNLELCDPALTYSLWGNSWVHPQAELPSHPLPSQHLHHWRENPQRSGETDKVIALDGKSKFIALPLQSGIHSAAKSSPVSNGNLWLVGSDHGQLSAFESDQMRWKNHFVFPEFGFHGSAVLLGDHSAAVGSYDGVLHLLDLKTGKRLWATKLGGAIGASPLIIGNKLWIPVEFPPTHSHVYALSLETGKILKRSPALNGLAHASLAYDADKSILIAATSTGTVAALNTSHAEVLWKTQVEGRVIATPLIGPGLTITISTAGVLSAHQTGTGDLLWQHKLPTGTRASPALAGHSGTLIVPLSEGQIQAYRIKDGTALWNRHRAHNHVSSGLVAWFKDQQVYWDQCEDRKFCALDVLTGKVLKDYPLPGTYSSTPAVLNSGLVITLDPPGGIWHLETSVKTR